MEAIILNGLTLDLEKYSKIVFGDEKVVVSKDSIKNIEKCRKIIEDIVDHSYVKYGINTGFGKFSNVVIDKKNTITLQKNIILSHAVGVGDPLSIEIAKGVMLLKLNSFLPGNSGVRYIVADTLVQMINKNVIPYIPEKGSVGASGDLAPLAHMALVMTGQGKAFYNGKLISGKKAMKAADITPLELQEKEGLAILNGTQVMTAIAAVGLVRIENILKCADITGAMSLEALRGTISAFDLRVQNVRPHPGQKKTAQNFISMLKDSKILDSHKKCNKVQDAYSLRCIPQVHGAIKDTYAHVNKVVLTEMNSITDNPLVFEQDNDVISGGNFHGEPIAFVMDFMSIALSELASISERRIEYMLDPATNDGLPAFLVSKGGLNSGHMMTQVTAASLVSENKVLSHPASVDSIPTSSNKEDHVSMGTHAARKMLTILENVTTVISIELLCAAQALDYRDPSQSAKAIKNVYDEIRKSISFMKKDRLIHTDIMKMLKLVKEYKIVEAAEKVSKELKI
ncbi:MAG: histidine ammonia-lyase [Candidatus Delongbacteria bacterium]|nr:histidine ammonia-lyase [Candidatus Delongbacteria bacterium]